MAKLIYATQTSLDGYVADADGDIDWAAPDDEVLAFINDLERPIGTYLYGRRLYEFMVNWETFETPPNQPANSDFARIWRAADKIVYSTTVESAGSARTKIEPTFDPDAVRALKDTDRDLTVGGPTLAAQALDAGLVDEIRVFVYPLILGGGLRFLPDRPRLGLELLEERRFDSGVVYVRYQPGNVRLRAAEAHP
ncbi:MAG TPA: dihydrofolate reductase family protein [Pseudonocardiaceae bacterium]|jgi:dihydrofolate reductase|nr:dihydrofolate reductase family protein [Pseudonocardiaceae bacterium]